MTWARTTTITRAEWEREQAARTRNLTDDPITPRRPRDPEQSAGSFLDYVINTLSEHPRTES